MGLVALALGRLRARFRPGILFALSLVLSGTERVLVEIIRRNHAVVAGLTVPQLFSLALVAAGVAWLVQAQKPPLRANSRPPAPPGGGAHPYNRPGGPGGSVPPRPPGLKGPR